MLWKKDDLAEQVLEKLGISFAVMKVDVSEIDLEASQRNLARSTPLDLQYVTLYSEQMRAGDIFPMIVVRVNKDGTKTICGGNHRLQAAIKCGVKKIDVMVISVTDFQFDVVAKALNSLHGRGTSIHEKCEQAVALCITHRMTSEDAAKALGLCKGTVQNHLNAYETRAVAAKHKIKITAPQTVLEEIGTVAKSNEPVAAEILRAISGQVISISDIKEIKKAVSQQKSETSKKEAIAKWMESRTLGKAKSTTASPIRSKVMSSAKALSSAIDTASLLSQTQMSMEDAESLVKMMDSTLVALRRLMAIG